MSADVATEPRAPEAAQKPGRGGPGFFARSRLVVIAAALAVLAGAVVAVLALAGGGTAGSPPANEAARLVPANALVYVHVSTDRGRPATQRGADLAARFPTWPALRDGIVKRLSAPGCAVGADALRSAREVALALFDTGKSATANSLVLVDTGREHPGARQRGCGALSMTYVGRFLAIGQPESLALAQQLARGQGRSLAGAAGPKKVFAELPADRVGDGWVSRDGVRRLLAPQGGLLGAVGVLFDRPALRGAGFALTATDNGARLDVHSLLDPKIAKQTSSGLRTFRPALAGEVPASAMAYLGVSNLAPALQRLFAAAGTGSKQLAPMLRGIDASVLKQFAGETAVVLTPATPAPVLTLLARTRDEAASRAALAKLPKTFATDVFNGKVVVSTSPEGLRLFRSNGPRLNQTDQWKKAVGNHPDRVSSLTFLDFSRLLTLGEQTGLGSSPAYQAAKGDLDKVRAIGAHTSGNDSESTAEISLLIP
jgi:hypothetical protein